MLSATAVVTIIATTHKSISLCGQIIPQSLLTLLWQPLYPSINHSQRRARTHIAHSRSNALKVMLLDGLLFDFCYVSFWNFCSSLLLCAVFACHSNIYNISCPSLAHTQSPFRFPLYLSFSLSLSTYLYVSFAIDGHRRPWPNVNFFLHGQYN